MNPSPVSKKDLLKATVFSLAIIFLIIILQINDRRTKIIFCDVGQGDAAYIRIKNQIDVLVDAGPDKKILNCLGKYMPFWDRTIEISIMTHSDYDHFGGFTSLMDHYHIGKMIVNNLNKKTASFEKFREKIAEKKIITEFYYAGDQITLLNDHFIFYWPGKKFNSVNNNDFSFVFIFQENSFRALFTSDASPFVLNRLLHSSLGKVYILKVPHHGSKNGLTEEFLELADPEVTVISVGKNNPYGHPSVKVLDRIKAKNIEIKRTDVNGDIVFRLR